MPIQPSRGDVHVNTTLSQLSVAYEQDQEVFVAGRVFPQVNSDFKSDDYFVFPPGTFTRNDMKDRAPSTESAGSGYKLETDTFSCRRKAFHVDIDDEIVANADAALNMQMQANEIVTQTGLIEREVRWANTYFQAGAPGDIWTFDVDGAATTSASFDPTNAANNDKAYWSLAASTPIEDIREGKRYVQARTGRRPNTLTISRSVFDTLVDHPDIVGRVDRGQTAGPAMAMRDTLAALFELEQVLVMDGVVDATPETQDAADQLNAFIAGDNALLSYAPPSPGLLTPSAGYTFAFTGYLGLQENGMRTSNFRMPHLTSERVEIESYYDQKLVSADLGYIFTGMIG